MKKYAIVVIGLVLAGFVLGGCQKGGTIKITNESSSIASIYVTKGVADGLLTPPSNVVARTTITGKSSGEISIDENGVYYVRAFYPTGLGGIAVPGTVKPMAMVDLLAGNSVSVTADD